MDRRTLVKSAMAMGAAAISAGEANAAPSTQEYYELRKYTMRNGPQQAIAQHYFESALIPALNRIGIASVGALGVDIGPETPTQYLLIPANSVETLATLEPRLKADSDYTQAAHAFLAASAASPAFERTESSLLSAFSGWPKLTAPKPGKRIFQLRTYESASIAAHQRKVQMFNEAEIAIFTKSGLNPVFFGDTIYGTRMPSLTYMLTFADVTELNDHWKTFVTSPEWKALSGKPELADAEIVSNISNLYLSPLSCSQI